MAQATGCCSKRGDRAAPATGTGLDVSKSSSNSSNPPAPGSMPGVSVYMRPLPDTCIDFASSAGKAVFREALVSGGMENYFRLSQTFSTQLDPAYCGLTTLTVVLNAFGIDPRRTWKGIWRWYNEELLDCTPDLAEVRSGRGITFDEFATISACNGLLVDPHRPLMESEVDARAAGSDFASFQRDVEQLTSSEEAGIMVVSYHRGTLGQTGSGHFSPVGGYHAAKRLVLLLDVARFKYRAHWVSIDLLWTALQGKDSSTGRPRGWFRLQPGQHLAQSVLYRLTGSLDSWKSIIPQLSKAAFSKVLTEIPPQASLADCISAFWHAMPAKLLDAMRVCVPVEYDDMLPAPALAPTREKPCTSPVHDSLCVAPDLAQRVRDLLDGVMKLPVYTEVVADEITASNPAWAQACEKAFTCLAQACTCSVGKSCRSVGPAVAVMWLLALPKDVLSVDQPMPAALRQAMVDTNAALDTQAELGDVREEIARFRMQIAALFHAQSQCC